MPVEIRELVIRAVVGGDEEAVVGEAPDVEEIVAICVREVLRVLERDRER